MAFEGAALKQAIPPHCEPGAFGSGIIGNIARAFGSIGTAAGLATFGQSAEKVASEQISVKSPPRSAREGTAVRNVWPGTSSRRHS